MKVLFISAKSTIDITPIIKKVKIKGKIGLASTIQFLNQLEKANKLLKDSTIAGQVLGCDASSCERIKDKVDSFLYIGSGKFHPIEIALKTNKPVYIANPLTNEFSKLPDSEIETIKKRIKGSKLKFLNAERIGILVSTKPGQYNLKKAIKLKEKLKKESFIFLFNTLNLNELENFPQIDCWVNTACPRIEGKNIINYEDLPEQYHGKTNNRRNNNFL